MDDAMVTGRMSKSKKEAGGRVLKQLGVSASQMVNDLYDYLIEHGSSPFDDSKARRNEVTPQQLAEALADIEQLCLPEGNRFQHMTDEQIRRERLSRQGM